MRIAGGIHPAAQFRHLLFEDRHSDAGGGLDPGEDLALGQRVEPGQRETAKERRQGFEFGRIGQCRSGRDKRGDVVLGR